MILGKSSQFDIIDMIMVLKWLFLKHIHLYIHVLIVDGLNTFDEEESQIVAGFKVAILLCHFIETFTKYYT